MSTRAEPRLATMTGRVIGYDLRRGPLHAYSKTVGGKVVIGLKTLHAPHKVVWSIECEGLDTDEERSAVERLAEGYEHALAGLVTGGGGCGEG